VTDASKKIPTGRICLASSILISRARYGTEDTYFIMDEMKSKSRGKHKLQAIGAEPVVGAKKPCARGHFFPFIFISH
jgi:hypothetical protein